MTTTLATLFGDRIQVYDTREAWLIGRSEPGLYAIGASDVRAILGHGYGGEGPWAVWARHHAPHLVSEPTAAQERDFARGHRYEAPVRDGYAERTGLAVETPLCIVEDIAEPWARCSPDGIIAESDDGPGLVEAKTVRSWLGWGDDGDEVRAGDALAVPPKIAAQVYWQLLVTGTAWCDVAACGPRWEERTVRVWADPDLQAVLLAQVAAWRERHLVGGEEPPHDGSIANRRWLADRYPAGTRPRAATASEDVAARRYASLGGQIKALEAERAKLAAELLASAGDASALLLDDGARCAIVRAKGRRNLSVTAVERQAPTLYAALAERGLVTTSDPTTSLRVYGLGEEE